jgi:DNA polymerase III subunit delta
MAAVSYDQLITDLQSKKYSPIYFLHGEEEYYIDKLVQYFEDNIISEDAKAFNYTVVYGKDIQSPRQIIDLASQFPMMSDKILVIIKEAQEFKALKDLVDYVKKPVPHAIIVMAHKHKKIDKRISIAKELEKHVIFESTKMYDDKLPSWIANLAKQKGLKLDNQIAALLAEYLGNDLSKIENEIDKLVLSIGKDKTITMDVIQDQIGISKEYNVFELQKAITEKDRSKAYLITKFLGQNAKDNPIQMLTSNLYGYFLKVLIASQNLQEGDAVLQKKLGLSSAYFLKDYKAAAKNYNQDKLKAIIQRLQVTDLQSKGVGTKYNDDDGALLKELVHFILF